MSPSSPFVASAAHLRLWGLLIGLSAAQAATLYDDLYELVGAARSGKPRQKKGRRGRDTRTAEGG